MSELGPFGAMHNAASGASMAGRWMDTLSHNMANVSTYTTPGEEPFRARFMVVEESVAPGGSGRGVDIKNVVRAEGEAPLIFDPSNPLADEDGLVQGPVVDLSGQMTDLIIANRHYQVNLRVVQAAHEAYQSALRIGRS